MLNSFKKKTILALIYTVCGQIVTGQQIDRPASLSQYGQYIQPFVENSHQALYRDQLDSFSIDFALEISFQIDTQGRLIRYQVKAENSPQSVQAYVQSLFFSTSGLWLPQISGCKKVVSDNITCFLYLSSRKISLEERLKRIEKLNEENWYRGSDSVSQHQKVDMKNKNQCWVYLNY